MPHSSISSDDAEQVMLMFIQTNNHHGVVDMPHSSISSDDAEQVMLMFIQTNNQSIKKLFPATVQIP